MHPILTFLRALIQGTPFENNVFVAGGYVRDLVLRTPSKDIDLVITLPDGGVKFAEWVTTRLGVRTAGNPVIFPRFGTAKFNLRQPELEDIAIEAVMPRAERYTEGSRDPEVQYTTLEEDAKRRDFTVNALFLNVSTGAVLDLVGGKEDIRAGRIRTAIDPSIIFVDDPLRMLRAIRFAVRFNWRLDDVLFDAIKTHAHRISTISNERVADELSKMLVVSTPSSALQLLRDTGLLALVLPELQATVGVTQNRYHVDDVFGHTLRVVDATPADLVTRLGALFHDIGKPAVRSEDGSGVHFYAHEDAGVPIAEGALRRLHFPNAVITTVTTVVREHMRLKSAGKNGKMVTDKSLRKLRAALGDTLPVLLDVMHADNCCHNPKYAMPKQIPAIRKRLETLAEVAPKVVLPINGNDVLELFRLRPGPAVGRLLAVVQDAWFADPTITREQAIQLLQIHVLKHGLTAANEV
jgi:poly(A) polymerase